MLGTVHKFDIRYNQSSLFLEAPPLKFLNFLRLLFFSFSSSGELTIETHWIIKTRIIWEHLNKVWVMGRCQQHFILFTCVLKFTLLWFISWTQILTKTQIELGLNSTDFFVLFLKSLLWMALLFKIIKFSVEFKNLLFWRGKIEILELHLQANTKG